MPTLDLRPNTATGLPPTWADVDNLRFNGFNFITRNPQSQSTCLTATICFESAYRVHEQILNCSCHQYSYFYRFKGSSLCFTSIS